MEKVKEGGEIWRSQQGREIIGRKIDIGSKPGEIDLANEEMVGWGKSPTRRALGKVSGE